VSTALDSYSETPVVTRGEPEVGDYAANLPGDMSVIFDTDGGDPLADGADELTVSAQLLELGDAPVSPPHVIAHTNDPALADEFGQMPGGVVAKFFSLLVFAAYCSQIIRHSIGALIDTGGTKRLIWDLGNGISMYINCRAASSSGPFWFAAILFGIDDVDYEDVWLEPVTPPVLAIGDWCELEVEVRYNTAGNSNGIVRVWLRKIGEAPVLIVELTDVNFLTAGPVDGIEYMKSDGYQNGATTPTISEIQYTYVDQMLVAEKVAA
jgi:hypothetical protein